jgi:perosamine synthetase
LQFENEYKMYNLQSFSIYLKENCPINRNDLLQELLNLGISTRRGVLTIHRETAYKGFKYNLPISEKLSDRSIIIPLYVPMNSEEIEYIIKTFKSFLIS